MTEKIGIVLIDGKTELLTHLTFQVDITAQILNLFNTGNGLQCTLKRLRGNTDVVTARPCSALNAGAAAVQW